MAVASNTLIQDDLAQEVLAVTVRWPTKAKWDSLAIQCGAGYRGSLANIRAWGAKRRVRGTRLRYFSLHLADGTVVGQSAVALDKSGGTFLDRVMLLPVYESLWQAAVRSLLSQLPPGSYVYGWEQSLERNRGPELAGISGVALVAERPLVVGAVEFGNWESWDAYFRAISTNIRRNVQKARKFYPDFRLRKFVGLRTLAAAPALIETRAEMYQRKDLGFDRVGGIVKTGLHLIANRERVFVGTVRSDDKTLGAFNGLKFGNITYYLEGGSTGDSHGASWLLLVEMLRQAYEDDPRGIFVMGYADMSLHDESVSGGLLRMRRSCRVTDFATSIVTFAWDGER